MTDKPGLWTDAERLDACRDALAAALASQRGDIAGVLEIWNGSTNTTALLLALAELPATAMHETGRRYDATFDVEGALRDVAAVLATAEPPTQEGSPDA